MLGTRYLYCGVESVQKTMPQIRESGLGVEVFFDVTTDLWPTARWENLLQIADEIQDAGIEAAVHGPFHNISLGSRDPNIRLLSQQMYLASLQFARAVHSPHMVIHSGFVPQYSPKARSKWLDQFCENIEPILDHASELEVRIALENTYEPDTSLFEQIFERIENPALGMCLDTGHATCFGKIDPAQWSKRFCERICHVHCSDNDGKDDLHLSLGSGVVDFRRLLQPLLGIGSLATVTFEVSPEDANDSRKYLDDVLKTL
jgi:sugar phosphate isomerase/epimerase